MILIENFRSFNLEGAIRGMRNPLNSHDKSDSRREYIDMEYRPGAQKYVLGEKDLELSKKLIRGGAEHRKFLRQIFVSMDITAPLYWWKEMDTYKVGTVANSESTMHTITKEPFTIDQFSHEHLISDFEWNGDGYSNDEFMYRCLGEEGETEEWSPINFLQTIIEGLNFYREGYLAATDIGDHDLAKKFWWQIIQLLPSSWNQKRTWTGNYEILLSILNQRSAHKLDEWKKFCDIICMYDPLLKILYEDSRSGKLVKNTTAADIAKKLDSEGLSVRQIAEHMNISEVYIPGLLFGTQNISE